MAPAASSILAGASAGAAAASKRPPAASDAEQQQQLLVDSSALPQEQGDQCETAVQKSQQPKQQQQLECPRCRSTNTKFCYYNNYSTAQPRHFCRACRRYWTHGGTLRDVPVGGATRRCKRRRVSAEPPSSPPPPSMAALVEDACPPDLASVAAFPFLSDGSYLPQFDLGLFAPPPPFNSLPPPSSSGVPDFYDGLAPWDDGTVGAGAWGDIAGLELTWPPPGRATDHHGSRF